MQISCYFGGKFKIDGRQYAQGSGLCIFQLPGEHILLPARDDLAEYEFAAHQSLK